MTVDETQLRREYACQQSEIVLVSSLVAQPDQLDELDLSYDEFSDDRTGLAYRTIVYLRDHDVPVTAASVVQKLATRIDQEHLTKLCDISQAQPWSVQHLAKIVRNESKRRRLLQASLKMREIASLSEEIDDNALAEAERALSEVSSTSENQRGLKWIADYISGYVETLTHRYEHRGELTGIDTGFRQLNFYIGGWQHQDLCIIAARPSVGKSAVMLQSALSATKEDAAAVFSLEMSDETVLDRLISSSTNMKLYNLRNGRFSDNEWPVLTYTASAIEQQNLALDVTSAITPDYIRSKLQRFKRTIPTEKRLVVFVDYLQIMNYAQKTRSRAEEVGKISTELKNIARDLNCCVVAMAQLNRNTEKQQDKRPGLADIRESGQIEQDADVIMLLYREDYYEKETEHPNELEVIIAKNRNGPLGTVKLHYNRDTQKITDITKEATP